MTREDLRTRVSVSLSEAGIKNFDLRVQPDDLGGWRLAVISDDFAGMTSSERLLVSGLEGVALSWGDFLTSAEAMWAGPLPADIDPSTTPLWAEALGRARSRTSSIFASDLDEDLTKPIITTFYSLRGGVGRSTALVNAARILASRGRRVVAVDMDLEAPGLASLFGIEAQVRRDLGVVSILTSLDLGEQNVDISQHLLRVGPDDLFCLPAGIPSADYARKLSFLDPGAWYREDKNPLRQMFELLRSGLPFVPDHVLIDSRTGISPMSGPLLFDVPDLAIVVFFPHPQAREGTRVLSSALGAARSLRLVDGHVLTPEPRFIASPVPGGDSFEKFSHRAIEWVGEWLQPLNEGRLQRVPLLETDVTHVVPYREALATSDRVSVSKRDWQDFEIVADWVDKLRPSDVPALVVATVAALKDRALTELEFPTGTAELQSDLPSTFIETDIIRKALSEDIPLVRGRKGTGKTALFRQLSENGIEPTVKIVAPGDLQSGMLWTWSGDAYREVDKIMESALLSWQFFWSFFIAARVHSTLSLAPTPPAALGTILVAPLISEINVIEAFEQVCRLPRRELLVAEWLRQLDGAIERTTLLIFDGLDTGFGNNLVDRERRKVATEGLFTFLLARGAEFKHLRLKILLREDIWRQLRFDNKSHLFGRDTSLSWQNSQDFYKVVLSHARKSSAFAELLKQERLTSSIIEEDAEAWSTEASSRAWVLLIGERMKGSGTTYTQNWVWNRLSDANSDRNPRYLLMLMNLVTTWERKENVRSRYERSIIRPRALEQQLQEVSAWALDAVREEFAELQPLLDRLANERTPLTTDLIGSVSPEIVALAQEVGLLGVYEERDGSPERYSVPEIYRLALNMKRRGQA
jgi:MinD-like ATPase involved in chromosome partitioning or flagellar assembly